MIEAPLLKHSPLDSNRFGIRIDRAYIDDETSVEAAVEAIRSSTADLIIARFNAGMCTIPNALLEAGETLIHADTLVYYKTALPAHSANSSENVRRATETDLEAIRSIASGAFKNYRAHYSANPFLSATKILDGYIEWAQSRADPSNPANDTWLVSVGEIAAGFATCDIQDGSVEIVLNAVHPSFERKGLYGTLLRHLLHHYSEAGMGSLKISTQIWNYTVQRQWARAGLLLTNAYDTYHIDRRIGSQRSKA